MGYDGIPSYLINQMHNGGVNMEDIKICIPRIDASISNEYIFKIFTRLKIGDIQKITDIPLRSDNDYKRVFIKVRWDMNQSNSEYMYTRLRSGETVKVVYEMPWYWKITASKL